MRTLLATLSLLAAGLIAPLAHAERTYVVGTDATFAPFESVNERREVVGFDVELIQAVAAKAGIKIKVVNTPWDALMPGLANGERDIVIAAMTITPERRQTLDFSAPYFEARQIVAVPQSSKVTRLADLKGRKIGVQTGTTGDLVVQKQFGKTSQDIRRFDNIVLALSELKSLGVAAVVADEAVLRNHLVNNPGLKVRLVEDASFAKEFYGIAVRKGNKELLAKLNAGLAAVKADGTYQRIHQKYFGRR